MREFNLPQFIDVEDRIVGPITVRQFLTMLGGGTLMVIVYSLVPFTFFVVLGVLLAVLTLAFSFVKINGIPLHMFLVVMAQTVTRPSLRVWRKVHERVQMPLALPARAAAKIRPVPTLSRLSELALMVDTGGVYEGEEMSEKN